jgi:hypothetical protein
MIANEVDIISLEAGNVFMTVSNCMSGYSKSPTRKRERFCVADPTEPLSPCVYVCECECDVVRCDQGIKLRVPMFETSRAVWFPHQTLIV